MFEQSLTLHPSSVAVLAAPDIPDEALQVTPEGVQTVLHCARAVFPTVVVDLKTFYGPKDYAEILQSSTDVVVLLRLDFASVRNCRRVLSHLEAMEIDRGKLHLVVNRFGQPKEIEAAKAEVVLGMKIGHYLPDDPKTVNMSINCGAPVVIESPKSPIAKAVVTIAHALAPGEDGARNRVQAASADSDAVPLGTKIRSFLEMNVWTLTPNVDGTSPVQ
jgi:Flp pilus assembly CpaE family ATPase